MKYCLQNNIFFVALFSFNWLRSAVVKAVSYILQLNKLRYIDYYSNTGFTRTQNDLNTVGITYEKFDLDIYSLVGVELFIPT